MLTQILIENKKISDKREIYCQSENILLKQTVTLTTLSLKSFIIQRSSKSKWKLLPSYLEKGITQSSGHPPIYSLEKYKREPEMESIKIKLENPRVHNDTFKKRKK